MPRCMPAVSQAPSNRKAGFADIQIERTKKIVIPDEVLQAYLDADTIQKYKAGNVGIYSITVTGQKRT